MAYKALSELTCIFLLLSLPFPLLWTGPSYTGWFCPSLSLAAPGEERDQTVWFALQPNSCKLRG